MEYDKETLKKVQQTELEILLVVDGFCKLHKIEYSLAYGTLIGAVRHQGFIPWDDDIDIMMNRDMYIRFTELWLSNPPKGYYLQNDVTDPGYPNNFLKIRKENTSFIQDQSELHQCKYRTGIFIDVFPLDRVAPKGIRRKIQYAACAVNMLMTRTYMSKNPSIIEKALFSMPNFVKRVLKTVSYQIKIRWNHSQNTKLPLFWNGTPHGVNTYFSSSLCDDYSFLEFEKHIFPVFSSYHEHLSSYFGDYLTLPPPEKRVNHKPIIVDFEHDYRDT